MKPRGLEQKLLRGVLAIFLIPTAVVEVVLVVLYRRGVFEDPLTLLLVVVLGLAADLAFLSRDMTRLGLGPLTSDHPVLDTGLLSRLIHGSEAEHTLEAVARRLGVTVIGRHSALGDALTTAEVFVRLLELLRKRGLVTLGQALDAVRRSRPRY